MWALDGVDLTVATGEVHGFLGPNGAGKTTTLRISSVTSRQGSRPSLLVRVVAFVVVFAGAVGELYPDEMSRRQLGG